MGKEVSLWFARNEIGETILIDKVDKNNNRKYFCPLCGSEVIPKAIKAGAKVSSHFAHIDRSKCEGETMIHWWCKHEMFHIGDEISFKVNRVVYKYICKEIHIEKSFKTRFGVYRPDITIMTECGQRIFYEIKNTNEKKIEIYHSKWLELKSAVLELDINNYDYRKDIKSTILFHKGKIMVDRSSEYMKLAGRSIEKEYIDNKDKEMMQSLEWLWNDLVKYKNKELEIEEIIMLLESIDDTRLSKKIEKILESSSCNTILYDINNYKLRQIENYLNMSDNILRFKATTNGFRRYVQIESPY